MAAAFLEAGWRGGSPSDQTEMDEGLDSVTGLATTIVNARPGRRRN